MGNVLEKDRPATVAPKATDTAWEHGSVDFYCDDRKYGFLKRDVGGVDVFVHWRTLKRNGIQEHQMTDGRKIMFKAAATGRRPEAVELKLK